MADLQLTKALDKGVREAHSTEEIRQLMHQQIAAQNLAPRGADGCFLVSDNEAREAAERGLVTPDNAQQNVTTTEVTGEPHSFKKTVVVAGRTMEFEAESMLALEQAISSAFRVAEALQQPQPQQRTVEQNVYERSEAELALRRGEIDAATCLERTNAIGDYLQAHGVPLESLQKTAAKQFEQSWESATAEFLRSSDGASWPGGQQNLEVIGLTIAKLGLVEADDKVAALKAAYAEMQSKHLLFDPGPSPRETLKFVENLSPAEILQAWKEQQGGDADGLNQKFMKSFSNTGSGSSLFGQS